MPFRKYGVYNSGKNQYDKGKKSSNNGNDKKLINICFFVIFSCHYQSLTSGRETEH